MTDTASDAPDPFLEIGRLLFAGDWQFVTAAPTVEVLPPMVGMEIALAGRSNVGKSSLVNALTGRKALARTSVTPGRTQELIFFRVGPELSLVDMPGYGFAKAPKEKVEAWTHTIKAYLRGRVNLARVFVLIDSRHGIKPVDEEILDLLDKAAVSYAIILTKSDQVKPTALPAVIAGVQEKIKRRPAAYPVVFPTSSQTGAGFPELRAAVARLLHEQG
ncbi:ribosome biogenesis GTP-binding protein YihA/YsxC [Xanthobacter oligotrophicus]|uniref:ribosome biogenesis GTP-binding protein YihA/YsxC n=1 Tax=Xanthobacter oligotrophicus TaxID=2607286 RepID=UPI0011F0A8CE|nr:ribosome biogenesis GTP-binding protein YihA/YsxC [Xanthobacter oligotrophicus]MCG5235470.1 ribosome biogenesis GTP-binding protein YihA/YsxC [Xanthobacter oligotrophicus]